ncbi:hypothetical protein AVEN_36524-1 [Araneus ventricosus]|uniref:Uncharacterized protein n=1 Tax=Araneus ventricosus TaxID=182803 RepID=A0A4Y2NFQ0_ARAVE|nr:hypothetical protein AVEN_36524-1 [Araneus ventricosus]
MGRVTGGFQNLNKIPLKTAVHVSLMHVKADVVGLPLDVVVRKFGEGNAGAGVILAIWPRFKITMSFQMCQLSMRDSVFILEATIDALGCNVDEFPIMTLHSDGKLLPALSARKSKEERLPVVIPYGLKEQLIAVPRLDNSSGKEQAQAFWKAILDWNLKDKVQIVCCDTTALNTGRFNGACALLEQTFYREMLFFACRHHVCELVLKAVFEVKIKQVTTSPDIPLFKKLKDN